MQRIEWGQVDGQAVYLYTLTNKNGLVAKITNYGTIITELHVPDHDGKKEDIVLGCANLDGYLAGHPHFGCTAGRVANRIANGRFTLDGVEYTLATNNGPNHLHGGEQGFDKKVWDVTDATANSLQMTYLSVDGEEGYPGNLTTTVTYTLTDDNTLEIEMSATTDAPTIVNLANHTYWNLAGHDSGDILGHVLVLNADNYTPVDETLIPTGEIVSVAETPFDFTQLKKISDSIAQLPGNGQDDPGGYDINFVLNGKVGEMKHVADVQKPNSGRMLEIYTTEPGVQFYSGNFLDGTVKGKGGNVYNKHAGFCLETQHYPDAINKAGSEGWDSIILNPGEIYRHEMLIRFKTQKVIRPEYMKAIAVIPGTPNSVHLADLKNPSVNDLPKGRENLPKGRGVIPDGRGVLVQVLQCGVDGTDKEINDAEYGDSPPVDPFLVI
ncbi:galactose-1-epimerase, partial [Candidatus Poribacteria bacterium]|nr:galactose-1-epimerase [Candidatus Poribacteria bacterium]